MSDGHEQQQLRKEVEGEGTVVIGFYKYTGECDNRFQIANNRLSFVQKIILKTNTSSDPDGKERQIYYKADKKGYQVSYDSKFENLMLQARF